MVFYGLLVVTALGLVALLLRSSIFRQVRRGRGIGRQAGSNATDHALARSGRLPRMDPAPQHKPDDRD